MIWSVSLKSYGLTWSSVFVECFGLSHLWGVQGLLVIAAWDPRGWVTDCGCLFLQSWIHMWLLCCCFNQDSCWGPCWHSCKIHQTQKKLEGSSLLLLSLLLLVGKTHWSCSTWICSHLCWCTFIQRGNPGLLWLKICPWGLSWVALTKLCSPGYCLHHWMPVLLGPCPQW